MLESWEPAPGFKRYYAVSNKGRVKRIAPGRGKGGGCGIVGRILSLTPTTGGYRCVELCTMDIANPKQVLVHILVATAFIGPKPSAKHEVAHWDGVGSNNHHTNLRWATSKENKADSTRHGTAIHGENHPRAKLTDHQVLQICRLRRTRHGLRELSNRFGVSEARISKICSNAGILGIDLSRKLTKDQRSRILQLYKQGFTQAELGKKFKVTQACISSFCTRAAAKGRLK